MRRDDAGYVTVEHAVCFAAVTLVIGVIAATVQAGLTGSSLCQAVREGARAASIGEDNAQDAATASSMTRSPKRPSSTSRSAASVSP